MIADTENRQLYGILRNFNGTSDAKNIWNKECVFVNKLSGLG